MKLKLIFFYAILIDAFLARDKTYFTLNLNDKRLTDYKKDYFWQVNEPKVIIFNKMN